MALRHEPLEGQRPPGRDRALEHRRLHGVDDDEDELLHRRIRRPAYFSPSRRRLLSRSHTRPATTSSDSGGKRGARAQGAPAAPSPESGQEPAAPAAPPPRPPADSGHAPPPPRDTPH